MRQRQLLEGAREPVELPHARFGADLVEHRHGGVVRERHFRILGRPDDGQQSDALRRSLAVAQVVCVTDDTPS